jgi:rhodanese-related sulfurtransferase
MKRLMLLSVVVIMAFMSACGGSSVTSTPAATTSSTAMPGTPVAVAGGGTYWSITPAQLYSMLKQSTRDFFMADADVEYIGEIASTDLFINSNNASQELDKFPADKTAKIVLYCTSGVHSAAVAAILVQAGYTRVMDLAGGIIAWQQQGYPTAFNTRTMT